MGHVEIKRSSPPGMPPASAGRMIDAAWHETQHDLTAIDRARPSSSAAPERIAPHASANASRVYFPHLRELRGEWPRAHRLLLLALLLVALLPTVSLVCMLWLGVLAVPSWTERGPSAEKPNAPAPSGQQASIAGAASNPGMPVLQQASATVVLTSPPVLEAQAEMETPFPVAIDGTDGLPANSTLAISGFPEGTVFSAGHAAGATWSLRPDEIGDLTLTLPQGANGEAILRVDLLDASGAALANTKTHIAVSPPPAPPAQQADQDLRSDTPATTEIADSNADAPAEPAPTAVDTPSTSQPAAKASPPPEPEQAPADHKILASTDMDASAVVSSGVTMRKGPGPSFGSIKALHKGTKLHVSGKKSGWLKVTDLSTNATGWVYNRFVSMSASN